MVRGAVSLRRPEAASTKHQLLCSGVHRPGGGQDGGRVGHPGRGEPTPSTQRPALHRHRAQQAQEPLPPHGEDPEVHFTSLDHTKS